MIPFMSTEAPAYPVTRFGRKGKTIWKDRPRLCICRGLLSACDSSEQSRIQRRSAVAKSTTIIAFDQHAATTVAAVLPAGHWTLALQPLASDSPTIIRVGDRLRCPG